MAGTGHVREAEVDKGRRPDSSSREETTKLWPRNRQQRVHQRSEQGATRRCTTRSRGTDSKEVAAARRQCSQVRRQRLRAHQQGGGTHWLQSQRRRGCGTETEAMVQDPVAGTHARIERDNEA